MDASPDETAVRLAIAVVALVRQARALPAGWALLVSALLASVLVIAAAALPVGVVVIKALQWVAGICSAYRFTAPGRSRPRWIPADAQPVTPRSQ